ncbi:MAG: hypothetical protein JSR91_06505 [Proteobacteria bacterium]|nr:hypothetical protein [Pseudomonadota bacterium]
MPFSTYKTTMEIEAADIRTMKAMSLGDYEAYLRDGNGLVWVDHHDVLRSGIAGYPIAANKAQLRAFIAYLRELEHRLGETSA